MRFHGCYHHQRSGSGGGGDEKSCAVFLMTDGWIDVVDKGVCGAFVAWGGAELIV